MSKSKSSVFLVTIAGLSITTSSQRHMLIQHRSEFTKCIIVQNRLPKRQSDRFVIVDSTPIDTYEKWLFCDVCKERLVQRKKHGGFICPECGEEYPADRGTNEYKNKGKLGTIEDDYSTPVVVLSRNPSWRRTPLSLRQRQKKSYEQMMEDEIQQNGFTLIDSHWETRE
jgi:DNA-directed RNA polymerase subunit M/transcription elongation factor TFIIS